MAFGQVSDEKVIKFRVFVYCVNASLFAFPFVSPVSSDGVFSPNGSSPVVLRPLGKTF